MRGPTSYDTAQSASSKVGRGLLATSESALSGSSMLWMTRGINEASRSYDLSCSPQKSPGEERKLGKDLRRARSWTERAPAFWWQPCFGGKLKVLEAFSGLRFEWNVVQILYSATRGKQPHPTHQELGDGSDGSSESGRKPHVIPHHISAKSTQDCDNEVDNGTDTNTPRPLFELEEKPSKVVAKMLKKKAISPIVGRIIIILPYSSVLFYCPPYHFGKIF